MDDLQRDLEKEQLAFLIAMDAIRDGIDDDSDPLLMFKQICQLLREYFGATASALLLVQADDEGDDIIVHQGMPQDMAHDLGREAMHFITPEAFAHSTWQHTLGLRIVLDNDGQIAGGIVLAHDTRPFTEAHRQLLQLAESQIDSAVMQARTLWRLRKRNRELEAIYHIDRLRDDAPDEETLYSHYLRRLQKDYQAQLCQLILRASDTDELETQHLIDGYHLSATDLQHLIEYTRDVRTPLRLLAPAQIGTFHLLTAPFIIGGERLGAVIIGRDDAFSVHDVRLLMAMTSQMDSAIVKSRAVTQLRQRNRELEAIYAIDHIRDQENDFDQMLRRVLIKLCETVASETGYIMLYDARREDELDLRATTSHILTDKPMYVDVIKRISRDALDAETVVIRNNLGGDVHSIIAIPLILNERIIGVFGALNSDHPAGFDANDGRVLKAITSQVDTAVFERLERRRMRQVLSRSVDPKVLEHLLTRADDSILSGERAILSVLFADLRGSTEWVETTDPEEIVRSLNTFLGMMTDVIFKYGGTLDKFVGDEVIALFGSPVEMTTHAYQAAQAAIEMQAVHHRLQREYQKRGRYIPDMGVGVSSGEVLTGEIGTPVQTDFTAIGRVMNLGARLCSSANGGQIIISENTYDFIKDYAQVREREQVPLKGIARTVQTYELLRMVDDPE